MNPFVRLSEAVTRMGLSYGAAELRDSVRLALQSAVAAVSTYLLLLSFGSGEFFVGILSAMLILQPSIGGPIGAAKTRIVATMIGSALGLLCLFTLPTGWGTAVALAITMLILNLLGNLKPEWSYGVVAAVALSLATGDDLVAASIARIVAISSGAAVGLLVSAVIWPDKAERRFERHIASSLRRMAEAVEDVVRKADLDGPEDSLETATRARASLKEAREARDAARLTDHDAMDKRLRGVDETLDSIWLLNGVMARTGDLIDGKLDEPMDKMRTHACQILHELADGDRPIRQLEQFGSAIDALMQQIGGEEWPDDRGGNQAQVICYALGALRGQLQDLCNTMPRDDDHAPAWFERVSRRT